MSDQGGSRRFDEPQDLALRKITLTVLALAARGGPALPGIGTMLTDVRATAQTAGCRRRMTGHKRAVSGLARAGGCRGTEADHRYLELSRLARKVGHTSLISAMLENKHMYGLMHIPADARRRWTIPATGQLPPR
ncbi:hypothetical protein [Mycobacterium sp. URHD0025]|uniref:hypothetical protein n=1 Tax=Mycobacterium sp. URHD0025 TaxID=1298864 RepID=UPI0012DCDBEC|nr:hypothetical protein [Mycobacterium sp. URHD0025]